ncbi:hypothetical protein AMECASPLE_038367, partial [Ameca splendens]
QFDFENETENTLRSTKSKPVQCFPSSDSASSVHRLDDVSTGHCHLVRQSSRGSIVHAAKNQLSAVTNLQVGRHLMRMLGLDPTGGQNKMFVELKELVKDKNQDLQWRETARWIRFEEDVEEETERWRRPHIASLSFHSLLELQKLLSHGVVLLDLKQKTLPDIAQQVVEQMVITDQIKSDDRAHVLRTLLLPH